MMLLLPPWLPLWLPWAMAGLTCLFGLLAAIACAQHAWHARMSAGHRPGAVTLILPLTGPVPELEALFAALAAQTLPPRRLIVAVEDASDPAHARALALAGLLPCPLVIALAGRSDHRGQKCTNLIAGFRLLDSTDATAVIFDADIRPQPWWLATLAGPALEDRWDLVTGYRWAMPGGAGPAAQMLAWFDRAIAVLPKPPAAALVWGGSLALSRRALDRLDLAAVLDRVLSDDLAIGAAARAAGLRVLTRRILLLPSPQEGTGFMLRQMRITHLHRPLLWRASLLVTTADLLGWVALLALALSDTRALALVLALVGLRCLRWWWHDRMARLLGAPDPPVARRRQMLVALAPPLVTLFVCGLMLRAVFGALLRRRLVWRHVTYEIAGPQQIRVVARAPGRMMRRLSVLLLCGLLSQPAAALHMRAEGETLRLSGPVQADDCTRLKAVLAMHPATLVVLGDSGGGDSEAGYCMGTFLRARGIETVIRGRCVSACSRIWLGGVRRRLEGPESRVGLHGNYNEDGQLVPQTVPRLRAWLPRYAPVDVALMERWIALPTNRWMMYFYNDRAEVCEGRVCTPLPGWDAGRAGLLG